MALSPKPNQCSSCAYVLVADDASTGLRCGSSYYEQPALVRQQKRLSSYPEVAADHHCPKWASKITGVLKK
jgi:hypothetical protein